MKWIASLLAAAAIAGAASPAMALRSTLDRVAATVNGDVITLRELERTAGSGLGDANAMPPGPERDEARAGILRAALDMLIADRLFKQQVKQLDLAVTDAQVDAQIAAVKEQNGFTDAELDRALVAQGISKEAYRERLREQLQNFAVLQYKVGGRVQVTDQELENYYRSHPQEFGGEEEIHVRHIFLPLAANAPPAEVRRVQEDGARILQRLKSGEDFAAVAKQVSRGPSAEAGGDLGWLKRGTIQKALEDAAFSLRDGRFSGLVRAGNGVHIVRVEGHRKGGARSFAEVKETIRDQLVNEQAEKYRTQYVDELRSKALIDIRMPELKSE